jgi:succinyl-CoA synthetase beta subunit
VRLFEYQAKDLFKEYSIPVPRGSLARTVEEVLEGYSELGPKVALKAQVLAGGRGKAGGIALVSTRDEAESQAKRIMSMSIGGERVSSILVETAVQHSKEMYLAVTLDRGDRAFEVISSTGGGIEVESLAGRVLRQIPLDGLTDEDAATVVAELNLEPETGSSFSSLMKNLERVSRLEECELAEINPLAIAEDGSLLALDAKVILDDNALFRHPEFSGIESLDPFEAEASRQGFAFVALDGEIAVIGNGAGLVLSTLDLLADAGGGPACFLDLGGGAQRERVEAAVRLVNRLPHVRKILVNIFGGITRTTDVAEGLKAVLGEGGDKLVYARISGAEEEKAKEILSSTGVKLYPNVRDAINAVVSTP